MCLHSECIHHCSGDSASLNAHERPRGRSEAAAAQGIALIACCPIKWRTRDAHDHDRNTSKIFNVPRGSICLPPKGALVVDQRGFHHS